jgi:sugar lactone lactonase YvrE
MSFIQRPLSLVLLALAATSLAACGGGGETGSTGTPTSSGSGGSGASTQSTGDTGGTGGTAGMGGTGGTSTGGTGGTTSTGGTGGTGGMPAACDTLKPGPIDPVEVMNVFNGSEDLAFDGKGHITGKDGNDVLLADPNGQTTLFATKVPTAYGLRYRKDGSLVVALPNDDKVVQVSAAGVVTDVALNLNGPNGLYPDFDGNVWMTEIGAGRVSRINPDNTVDILVSGPDAAGANGVVLDAARKILYYTNYGQGRVRSIDMSPGGDPTPLEVIQIQGAKLDGLVMDGCGHLYAMDQGGSQLYRIKLDPAGAAAGPEELMATFPKNVANAQFGSGPGFDPSTLYAAGNPGRVYSLAVGVPGAPVPTPPRYPPPTAPR